MDDSINLQAEVLSIGDELTSGQRLDTNSQWLSARLAELGIRTIRHTTVGDDLAGDIEALRLAAGRADVVVVSGGLGPTLDDLTRQALADAFECPLELDVESLEHIRQLFARRHREMPARNQVQAMFPRGARVIPNPHGSAPGIDMSVASLGRRSRIFALPGVPAELKEMWTQSVVPRIEAMLGASLAPWRYYAVKLFGIGESDVEVRLPNLIDRRRAPTVGITVSHATITLRIAARAQTDGQFADLIAPTLNEIQQALGELIFGAGDDELEHAILRKLAQQRLKLATVEIGAASWINQWMLAAGNYATELDNESIRNQQPGSSTGSTTGISAGGLAGGSAGGFVGGLAFPTLVHAARWFMERGSHEMSAHDSHDSQLRDCDVLDWGSEIWKPLMQQARQRFAADVVLVVNGYPSPRAVEVSAGQFDFDYVLAIGDELSIDRRSMSGHPDVLGPRAAKTGLDILRKKLALRAQ
ncbi:MAG: molybdopterin-binding protein [Pirellulaceae bacterium]